GLLPSGARPPRRTRRLRRGAGPRQAGAHRPWVRSSRTRARVWIPGRAPARVVWYGARGESSAVCDRARDYGVTPTVAVPVAPWNVAAIFVEPTPAPVTSPVAATVAMPGFWVAQLTVPEGGAPFQSVIATSSCTVPLIATVGADGVTVMVKLPNVTTIAWSPVSGVRVIATVALVPD